jgi:pimeloyl-ACP methyl ester carboxylesterase
MVAAQWPALVSKLILVGSGPFEARYAAEIMPERLRRLSDADRAKAEELFVRLTDDPGADDGAFARLGVLLGSADAFDPLPRVDVPGETQPEIYASVWPEAAELRKSGRLLELASKVECPVLAIHGAYDPHPAAGVRDPLTRVLKDFRFVLLPECGHTPWVERRALDEFYHLLEDEF